MSSLMLVNPAKRIKRSKKARTPAQKAATRRMLAANRARRSPVPSARTKRRRAANVVQGYFPNPARKRSIARVSRKVGRTRYKRNPIGGMALLKGGNLMNIGVQSLQGAGGALLVNTALNYIPFLPPMLKSGNGKYMTRAAGAVLLGVFGGKILGNKIASNMAVGALTVAAHDMLLGLASTFAPTMLLGDVGDYDNGVSEYEGDSAIGEFVSGYDDVYGGTVGEYIAA